MSNRSKQQTFSRVSVPSAQPDVQAAISDIYDKFSQLSQGLSVTITFKKPDDSTGTLTFTRGMVTAHT